MSKFSCMERSIISVASSSQIKSVTRPQIVFFLNTWKKARTSIIFFIYYVLEYCNKFNQMMEGHFKLIKSSYSEYVISMRMNECLFELELCSTQNRTISKWLKPLVTHICISYLLFKSFYLWVHFKVWLSGI